MAAMAKHSTGCTSTCVFVLLSLAVCIMVTTSAPTGQLSKNDAARILHSGVTRSLQAIANGTLTNITEEFQVPENKTEVVEELCRIVAYYHLVEAVDNGSDIHSNLRVNANDALTYWKTAYCSDCTYCSDCNATLTEFRWKCERAALHPMMKIPATFWRDSNSLQPQDMCIC